MSASVAPTSTDRSDFRTVMVSGTKMGALTAVAVVLFLLVARFVPDTGGARRGLEALLVLAAGGLAGFLPGRSAPAPPAAGVARGPAIGLRGPRGVLGLALLGLRALPAHPSSPRALG